MKLLFFPALLYCFLFKLIYKNAVPNVSLPLLSGILTGTTLIPVFFYTYSALRLSGSILLFFTFVLESLFQWHPNYMSRKISHVSASSYMDWLYYIPSFSLYLPLFSRILPCFKIHDFSYRVRLRLLLFSICLSLHFSVCFPVHFPIHFPSSVRGSGFPSRTALFKISSIL